ncbi:unnamed protein product [Arabis nemorensis]|uniref:Uncharacterized protein n=1 Tax=Arabis nemorensis TaxID=586526 RepID=A0A565AWU1_9BRAS|nr:unnamed protein product [Arabis nemorensis]
MRDPIAKKLDRCLINGNWQVLFPTSDYSFEAPEFLDHAPCHIKLFTPPPDYGTRPFKFFNLFCKHPSFLDSVTEAWLNGGEESTTLKSFCYKLKSLKRPLKTLLKENYSDIEQRCAAAKDNLKSTQLQSLHDPSTSNLVIEKTAREAWLRLCLAEESFFRQKSRIKWLAEGDFNTTFFHLVTKLRNASNVVKNLNRLDGTRVESSKEIHEFAVGYYSDLLGTIQGEICPELADYLNELPLPRCTTAH